MSNNLRENKLQTERKDENSNNLYLHQLLTK